MMFVTAKYKGSKNIDLKKVRFASEPNTAALPAKFNEAEQTWTISLRPYRQVQVMMSLRFTKE